ncbi:hypothetical protein DTO282F9_6470 [Paecilomyces variotii]|nr:hypothetical protein DTO027B9_7115 [Paecilomyces variotii]KAJ9368883.1 hypothetical protein DTO282E5_6483 [Paecilomyces variotii]KAJ9396650.1 hypothetical protein DTO282F9_6470 [Paecilomyces variotii]
MNKGRILTISLSVCDAAVSRHLCLIESAKDIDKLLNGSILVTEATDPDWVPIMKRAAGIITDHGGRTSHAAIVSRELGIPKIVGTGNSTYVLDTGQEVTVSCAVGDNAFVYEGISTISTQTVDLAGLREVETKVILNLSNPASAYRRWRLPEDGIGLARMEFVVTNAVQVHPTVLVHYDRLKDQKAKEDISKLTTCQLGDLFNEQDEAVKGMMARVIAVARRKDCKIGICGQAPSNYPEFAKFLVEAGINSISISPDSFVAVEKHVVANERACCFLAKLPYVLRYVLSSVMYYTSSPP